MFTLIPRLFAIAVGFAFILACEGNMVAATNCRALGTWVVNSAGFGPGGNTVTSTGSIELFKDDKSVGKAVRSVCTDSYSVTSQLPLTFGWAASCDINHIKECHGAYGDQTHIVGDKATKKVNFVGIGESVISTCNIPFNC